MKDEDARDGDFGFNAGLAPGGVVLLDSIPPAGTGGEVRTRAAVRSRAKKRLRIVREVNGIQMEIMVTLDKEGVISLAVNLPDPRFFAELTAENHQYLGRNMAEITEFAKVVWVWLYEAGSSSPCAWGTVNFEESRETAQPGPGDRRGANSTFDKLGHTGRASMARSKWKAYFRWISKGRPVNWRSPLSDNQDSESCEKQLVCGPASPLMTMAFDARRIAKSALPVMLKGESGTGKELIYKALHAFSDRSSQPCISINCGALPPERVEAELFGWERGSFPGALERPGYFELADPGTIFLDEVSNLPLDAQPKLHRVVESGEVWRVGATRPRHVDVRIVTATNKALKGFMSDLRFRLAALELSLPPLRDRLKCDMLPLVCFFSRNAQWRWSRGMFESFFFYRWPGNVRELENLHLAVSDSIDSSVCEVDLKSFLKMHVNQETKNGIIDAYKRRQSREHGSVETRSNAGESKVSDAASLADSLKAVCREAGAEFRPLTAADEEIVRSVVESVKLTFGEAWGRLDKGDTAGYETAIARGLIQVSHAEGPGRGPEPWFDLLVRRHGNKTYVTKLLLEAVKTLHAEHSDLTHEREEPFYAGFHRFLGADYYDLILGDALAGPDVDERGELEADERQARDQVAKLLAGVVWEFKSSLGGPPDEDEPAADILGRLVGRKVKELQRWLKAPGAAADPRRSKSGRCFDLLTAWRGKDSAKKIILQATKMLDDAGILRSTGVEENHFGKRYVVQEAFLGVSRRSVDIWAQKQ